MKILRSKPGKSKQHVQIRIGSAMSLRHLGELASCGREARREICKMVKTLAILGPRRDASEASHREFPDFKVGELLARSSACDVTVLLMPLLA